MQMRHPPRVFTRASPPMSALTAAFPNCFARVTRGISTRKPRDQMKWLKAVAPEVHVPHIPFDQSQRVEFQSQILTSWFQTACTCNICRPDLYLPYANCPAHHLLTDLIVEPGQQPTTRRRDTNARRRFEALHLANAIVQYCSRPEMEMSIEQSEALTTFRDLVEDKQLLEKMELPDC
jgi:hypothetical protein